MNIQQLLIDEIGEETKKGKGCIILDLACFFPYSDQEALTFRFKCGENEPESYKYNHRYPNKHYVTISKQMGQKVSKLGYPYFVDLNKETDFLLQIEVGIEDGVIKLIFPVKVLLTEDKPVCSLTLHFNFEDMSFLWGNAHKDRDGRYYSKMWTNREVQPRLLDEDTIIVDDPTLIDDGFTALYSTTLTPFSQALNDLLIW